MIFQSSVDVLGPDPEQIEPISTIILNTVAILWRMALMADLQGFLASAVGMVIRTNYRHRLRPAAVVDVVDAGDDLGW